MSEENTDDSASIGSNTNNLHRRREIISSLTCMTQLLIFNNVVARADIAGVATPPTADPNPSKSESSEGFLLYTTKSGLKYIEVEKGSGVTPKYGNLCSISYTAYIKLPGKASKLQKYDKDNSYLVKHGNGRMIPGLDEGIHTMAVGGKRRIIIPPKLGYVGPGVLGPLPETPWDRYRLNKLLDQMIEFRGGNVIFDVEMKNIIEDEADQGYYNDSSLTPEEFDTLRRNLRANAKAARERGENVGKSLLGEDNQ